MKLRREDIKKEIVDIIRDVVSEELKIPRENITEETELPTSKDGMMVVMRMAKSIPGGGIINVSPTNDGTLCTVNTLAEKCTEQMVRLAKAVV